MWAAGGGHLDITCYLIEYCKCDPSQSQRGKRSFAGRTALHWAARNGHLDIVRYLLTSTSCSSGSDTVMSCDGDSNNPVPSKESTTPPPPATPSAAGKIFLLSMYIVTCIVVSLYIVMSLYIVIVILYRCLLLSLIVSRCIIQTLYDY